MTINLNGVEFYSAQEVDARIREALSGKYKKVDMTNLPIGTLVKVVDNIAGHGHEVGEILPITEVGEEDDKPAYRLDDRISGWVAVEDIEFVSFPEEEESTSGNGDAEDDKDGGFEVGDKAEVIIPHSMFNEGEEIVIVRHNSCGSTLARNASGEEWNISVHNIKKIDEDGSEIKAGDIVIATEDEFDITEGYEYEIKERESGTLYFHDDDGDIRYVNVHEEILRKKSDKRGFKKGDIVCVNEEITDSSGDSICPGVITEFLLERWVLSPNGSIVVVGDGDIGKLTLVCRAEDRMDKSKEDE